MRTQAFAVLAIAWTLAGLAVANAADPSPPSFQAQKLIGKPAYELARAPIVRATMFKLFQGKTGNYRDGKGLEAVNAAFPDFFSSSENRVEKLPSGQLFAGGTRKASPNERAFIVTEPTGQTLIVGILYYSPSFRVIYGGRVDYFSSKKTVEELPAPVQKRIDDWLKVVTDRKLYPVKILEKRVR